MHPTIYKVKSKIGKETPTILTIFGVSGVLTTAFLAGKNTAEAIELLWNQDRKDPEDFDLREKVELTWKCYIPTAISGVLTAACILGANSINLKRNAALAGMYVFTVESLREYQDKVIETIGRKKNDKILEDISEDRIRKNPPQDGLIVMGGGDVLFYDSFSGRYFESTMEKVRRAINSFNFDLFDEMYKPINEFYELIELEDVDAGNRVGWHIDQGKMEVRFDAKIVNAPESRWHDEPCIVISYRPEPKFVI